MARLMAYASCSLALAASVVVKALNERANFYSASIYLSQSNSCVIILVNLLILMVGVLVFGLQRLLYGPLRPIEAEQLYDKAWFAITETCLAMTIFREEIGVWFIILFISLLVGKVWAWIGEGRVEILDQQPPAHPRLFHTRLSTSLLLSLVFDGLLLSHSISTVHRQAKPNMMVMFAFEFAVLTTSSVSTAIRYLISLQEAYIIEKRSKQRLEELRSQRRRDREEAVRNGDLDESEPLVEDPDESDIELLEWEDKSRWILYLELLTDLVRLVLYLVFFVVLCVFYGMPLHIVRDVAIALRSFHKRLTDFVRYRHATRDMNERYADATVVDIGNNDVCIICREPMIPWRDVESRDSQRSRPKKLPCGHILHFGCLRRWLQWQQNCPTCRQPVLENSSRSGEQVIVPADREPEPEQIRQRRHDRTPAPAQGNVPAREAAAPFIHDGNNNDQAQVRQPVEPAPVIRDGQGWRRFHLGPLTMDNGARQGAQQPPPNFFEQGWFNAPSRETNDFRDTYDLPTNIQQGPLADLIAVQFQIDLVEQRIAHLMSDLRTVINQLVSARMPHEGMPGVQVTQAGSSRPPVQIFRSDSTRGPLLSGAEDLPPGLVLPDGWTITPLNRSHVGNNGHASTQDERGLTRQTSETNHRMEAPGENADRIGSEGNGDQGTFQRSQTQMRHSESLEDNGAQSSSEGLSTDSAGSDDDSEAHDNSESAEQVTR